MLMLPILAAILWKLTARLYEHMLTIGRLAFTLRRKTYIYLMQGCAYVMQTYAYIM